MIHSRTLWRTERTQTIRENNKASANCPNKMCRRPCTYYVTSVFWTSVQFSRSVMFNSLRPHESQHARPPCPHQLPEFTQTHVHRVSDAIQPSHPRLSPSPPAPNLSQHQSLFQWVNSSHEGPKYWSFSFSIIPPKEIPGLISFRMDWLDLLAVQGTLKSLLQHHSSKTLILQCSAFFTVQLSHPYMTTGKIDGP